MTPPNSTDAQPDAEEDRGDTHVGRWATAAFVATSALFVMAWPYIVPDVEPGYPLTERAVVMPDGTFRMTMNVTERELWVPFDMGQGQLVDFGDAPDLLLKRYVIRAPGGAKDLGAVSLGEADATQGGDWVEDAVVDGDWMNTAMERWYEYSMSNHLLTTKRHTYAIRRSDETTAYFQVESYYCDPPGSGCMTVRYRLGE